MKAEISVILINYNSSSYTKKCIESIVKETQLDAYEIIVVDNNSDSESFAELEQFCKSCDKVFLFRSKINLGFSAGNMLGSQFASGDYLFFLNNDCILKNDNLSILKNFIASAPDFALATGQMFNSKNDFHSSFAYFPDLKMKIFGKKILSFFNQKDYPERNISYKSPIAVPLITGAAMFFDKKLFSEIGGFDTNYFLYCEEEDIGLRLKKMGYKTYLVPEAEFIHFGSGSTQHSFELLKEFYISFLYFLKKHYSFPERIALRFLYFLKNVRKFYKSIDYLKIALLILRNAGLEHSLKHKQKLR